MTNPKKPDNPVSKHQTTGINQLRSLNDYRSALFKLKQQEGWNIISSNGVLGKIKVKIRTESQGSELKSQLNDSHNYSNRVVQYKKVTP